MWGASRTPTSGADAPLVGLHPHDHPPGPAGDQGPERPGHSPGPHSWGVARLPCSRGGGARSGHHSTAPPGGGETGRDAGGAWAWGLETQRQTAPVKGAVKTRVKRHRLRRAECRGRRPTTDNLTAKGWRPQSRRCPKRLRVKPWIAPSQGGSSTAPSLARTRTPGRPSLIAAAAAASSDPTGTRGG